MIHSTPKDTGWIEVICGPMFSGKTEELIRRIRRAEIARQKVVIFKPLIDDRYAHEQVVSHDQRSLAAVPIKSAKEILERVTNQEVIGIDEAQFFGPEIVQICEALADRGKRVVVSGLDQDYRGLPFDPIPQLLAVAEYITKNLAICVVCGNPAGRNQRMTQRSERVLIGGADSYEARCRRCFDPQLGASMDDETPLAISLSDA